jgi:glycosyltransferase involved in cell wall biosynthesis
MRTNQEHIPASSCRGFSVVIGPSSAYEAIMITAIIETRDDEVLLAHALAALVPAATEGVVREVIIIDQGSHDGTLVVADAAGCTIIDARAGGKDPHRQAAEIARGDWLLLLSPSSPLLPGWQSEALAFIDRALIAGKARSRVATIRGGSIASGWRGWLRARLTRSDGWLMTKSAYLAARPSLRPSSAASRASGARRGAA